MNIIDEKMGCFLLDSNTIFDNRGWFQVAVNIDDLRELGLDFRGVCQWNHSKTDFKGVVRGLNYQEKPFEQAKIIRCPKGSFYSVAVNIDPKSKDFGSWCGFELSEKNGYVMYIPARYAQGFVTNEDDTELEYLTDRKYSELHAKSIRFDDPDIGIDWTQGGRITLRDIMSEKNKNAPLLSELFYDWKT